MLVRHQPRLALLHLAAAARSAACSAGSRTRSGSVLMNSPTMLSMPAISGGRPATVTPNTTSVAPGQTAEQDGPGRLDEGVERETLRARLLRQRRASAPRSAKARSAQAQPAAAPGSRGARCVPSSSPAKRLPPGRNRRRAILPREPRQIVPVRRHPRQRRRSRPARIKRQQLPHQHRHRPAVQQDVMVGQHQPMLRSAESRISANRMQRRRAQDRTARARSCASNSRQPLRPLRRIQQRQIDAAPRHRRPAARSTCTGRLRSSCRKPARRLACRSTSACTAARSAAPSSAPSSPSSSCTV